MMVDGSCTVEPTCFRFTLQHNVGLGLGETVADLLNDSHLVYLLSPSPSMMGDRPIEYVICAFQVGIQTKEGVILAVEKRLTSTLLEPSSVVKVPLSFAL